MTTKLRQMAEKHAYEQGDNFQDNLNRGACIEDFEAGVQCVLEEARRIAFLNVTTDWNHIHSREVVDLEKLEEKFK